MFARLERRQCEASLTSFVETEEKLTEVAQVPGFQGRAGKGDQGGLLRRRQY